MLHLQKGKNKMGLVADRQDIEVLLGVALPYSQLYSGAQHSCLVVGVLVAFFSEEFEA